MGTSAAKKGVDAMSAKKTGHPARSHRTRIGWETARRLAPLVIRGLTAIAVEWIRKGGRL
jgi:hypothetical protein